MKKIRVAFVGLAHTHAPILGRAIREHIEDYEIVGFAEAPLPIPDMECYTGARALFKDEMGIKEYENWRDLLDVDLDLCIVNSTNASREEICCAFLDKGVHVLDEKPMATDYKGALHMCRSLELRTVHPLPGVPSPIRRTEETRLPRFLAKSGGTRMRWAAARYSTTRATAL